MTVWPGVKVEPIQFSKESCKRNTLKIYIWGLLWWLRGFPYGSAGKESACNVRDLGSIPGLGRSPGEGKSYPLQYFGLENSMDCTVHGVAKSPTRLSGFHFTYFILARCSLLQSRVMLINALYFPFTTQITAWLLSSGWTLTDVVGLIKSYLLRIKQCLLHNKHFLNVCYINLLIWGPEKKRICFSSSIA